MNMENKVYNVNSGAPLKLGYQTDYNATHVEFQGFTKKSDEGVVYIKIKGVGLYPLLDMGIVINLPFMKECGRLVGQLVELTTDDDLVHNSPVFEMIVAPSVVETEMVEPEDPNMGIWFTAMGALYEEVETKLNNGEFIGPKGDKGDKGDTGARGPKGEPGYTPIKGVDYFDGKDGKDGADGKDGYTPIKGVDYTDGKDGYTPIKGVDYFDGARGPQGERGFTGLKGDKGDRGYTGAQGPQGVPGLPGSDANVTASNIERALGVNVVDILADFEQRIKQLEEKA